MASSNALLLQNTAIAFANAAEANMNTVANNAIAVQYPSINQLPAYQPFMPVYGGGGGNPPADITLPGITATKPVVPSLLTISIPAFGDAPTFSMAQPIINIPTAPSSTLPLAPGNAPAFNAPALPAYPVLSLPAVPVFSSINIPGVPNITVPVFSAALPVDDIVAPSAVFAFSEQMYDSAMLDALKLKLMQDLSNGGYGIEPNDELALWQRATEREVRGAEVGVNELIRSFASRGMSMPSGALSAALQRAQQAVMEKTSSLSREIALKRADMYVENRKFTIEQVRGVEQMLMQYTGSLMERGLNAAKALVELGIASFNARVAKYQVTLETYKAAAQVYESLIRGALLQLESYKAQVEGARLTADVQRIQAEVYRIQLDGVNTLVNLYTAEANAAKILVEIEVAKLDAFKTQVETYTAQVGAKTAEFGMFETQIKGELAKEQVYSTAASAYAVTVDAYKAKAEAADVVLRAQLGANSGTLDAYRSDIARYTAELEAAQISLTTVLSKYDADVKKYSVTSDVAIKNIELGIESSKAAATVATANAKMQGDFVIAQATVATEQARSVASVNGQLASAYGAVSAGALSSAISILTGT